MNAPVASRVVEDPPLARFLFADTRLAPLWLVIRLYVGYAWFDAGWHKIMDTGAATNYIIDGKGILAFWQRIAAIPAAPAKPVITYDWYRDFIQFMIDNHWEGFFGKLEHESGPAPPRFSPRARVEDSRIHRPRPVAAASPRHALAAWSAGRGNSGPLGPPWTQVGRTKWPFAGTWVSDRAHRSR